MEKPRTLVVYYSRTGTTRKVALAVADALDAEVEELIDRKERAGVLGFVMAGKDAAFKKTTEIDPPKHDPADFDLVVLGTPVWAGTMCCAVRTYLSRQRDRLPRVAFLVTTGGTGIRRCLRHLARESGREPVATLALRMKDVLREAHVSGTEAFVEQLRTGCAGG